MSPKLNRIINVIVISIGLIAIGFAAYKISGRYMDAAKDRRRLAGQMRTQLPEMPKEEVNYPVPDYDLPGECLVGSSLGLIEYLEPDIDMDTFMLYAIPTAFGGGDNGRYGPGMYGMWCAFENLGYTVYRGSPFSRRPPQSTLGCIKPENLITFKSSEKQFEYIKKLLSAKIIPIILGKDSVFIGGPDLGGSFKTITGYDKDNVWANFHKEGGADFFKPLKKYYPEKFPNETFIKGWGVKDILGLERGGFEFFWMEKSGEPRKTLEEILAQNKEELLKSPANIQKTIDYFKANKDKPTSDVLFDFTGLGVFDYVSLSRYWKTQGKIALSDKYMELAKLRNLYGLHFSSREPQADLDIAIETLEKEKAIVEQIIPLWP